ncbi:hypothetical protein GCM10022255_065320 [Dactylosporangium darangshiense]|uniref:Uncharacterized protein n=1 Tax=Dactylosporangium darangshiense TaxID=579108 RepID=A0ABP8DGS4_9ACTN
MVVASSPCNRSGSPSLTYCFPSWPAAGARDGSGPPGPARTGAESCLPARTERTGFRPAPVSRPWNGSATTPRRNRPDDTYLPTPTNRARHRVTVAPPAAAGPVDVTSADKRRARTAGGAGRRGCLAQQGEIGHPVEIAAAWRAAASPAARPIDRMAAKPARRRSGPLGLARGHRGRTSRRCL